MKRSSVDVGDRTQEKLLAAAKAIFARKGYHGTRVADIVEEAGFAQGTFYLHFASKEAVFRQLVDRFYAEVFERALRVASPDEARTAGEAIDAIHTVWLTALKGFCRDRELARVILREAQAMNPDVSDVIQAYHGRTVESLVACVRGTVLREMARDLDLDLVGWAVVGMFERVAYQKIVLEGRDDVEYIADQLFRFELHGLLQEEVPSEL